MGDVPMPACFAIAMPSAMHVSPKSITAMRRARLGAAFEKKRPQALLALRAQESFATEAPVWNAPACDGCEEAMSLRGFISASFYSSLAARVPSKVPNGAKAPKGHTRRHLESSDPWD